MGHSPATASRRAFTTPQAPSSCWRPGDSIGSTSTRSIVEPGATQELTEPGAVPQAVVEGIDAQEGDHGVGAVLALLEEHVEGAIRLAELDGRHDAEPGPVGTHLGEEPLLGSPEIVE